MDSREKVLVLRKRLLELRPEDEETAQGLQMLAAISPLVLKLLPDDPGEIDRYLRTIAAGAAACRSDDAQPLQVFELVGEGEEAGWRALEL